MTATELRHFVRGLVPVFRALQDRIEALEAKADRTGPAGVPGRDGQPGLNGRDGEKGADGLNGRDGEKGVDGTNGRDGADGLGFDDLELVFDELKGYVFRFAKGERVKEQSVPLPYDAGIWTARRYPQGACVTKDGAYWVATKATTAKPGDESKAWRLCVKQGRDGKGGPQGPAGKDWLPGDPR